MSAILNTPIVGRVPPSDLDAEAAVLSACLLDQAAFDRVQAMLHPKHFYADANRRIYETIIDLSTSGKPVDVVGVASLLREREKLQQVGGTPYIAQLSDATPAVAHIEHHAQTIVDRWYVRQVIHASQTIATEGYGGDIGPVTDWLQEVDARMYAVTRRDTQSSNVALLGVAAAEETERIRERKAGGGKVVRGITTGMPTFDARIGNLQRGNKYTIAGRTGMGKTGLLLTMALAAARKGHGVVICSLEMPRDQLALRALAQEANIDSSKLGRGRITDEQFKGLVAACVELGKLPVIIFDQSKQTVASVRACVREGRRQLREKYGPDIEVEEVLVDFLQIMDAGERATGNDVKDLQMLSLGLAQLAKDENCVVLEASQLNRDLEKRPRDDRRPKIPDIRGAGAVEEQTFGIFFIYRDDKYKKEGEARDNKAELIVAKLRQGGAEGTVHVKFKAETTLFYETSRNPDIEQLGDMFDNYLPGTYNESDGDPPRTWQDDYDK